MIKINFKNEKIQLASTFEAEYNDSKYTIEGYALKYTDEITDRGFYNLKLAPNCAVNADKTDVVLNINHNDDLILARTTNNRLILEDRPDGLFLTAKIDPEDVNAVAYYKQIKNGSYAKMSFRGEIGDYEWDEENQLLTVTSFLNIKDVSAVSFPAFTTTEVVAFAKESNEKKRRSTNV